MKLGTRIRAIENNDIQGFYIGDEGVLISDSLFTPDDSPIDSDGDYWANFPIVKCAIAVLVETNLR